jgi:hypothetical protein
MSSAAFAWRAEQNPRQREGEPNDGRNVPPGERVRAKDAHAVIRAIKVARARIEPARHLPARPYSGHQTRCTEAGPHVYQFRHRARSLKFDTDSR